MALNKKQLFVAAGALVFVALGWWLIRRQKAAEATAAAPEEVSAAPASSFAPASFTSDDLANIDPSTPNSTEEPPVVDQGAQSPAPATPSPAALKAKEAANKLLRAKYLLALAQMGIVRKKPAPAPAPAPTTYAPAPGVLTTVTTGVGAGAESTFTTSQPTPKFKV